MFFNNDHDGQLCYPSLRITAPAETLSCGQQESKRVIASYFEMSAGCKCQRHWRGSRNGCGIPIESGKDSAMIRQRE
jgi:hypothetical protein